MAMMGFGPGRIDFVAIDTDGNGSLSRAELVARATERLARVDGDGNGTLTRAELVAAMPAPRLLDLFGPNPGEAYADRVLALMGATESGEVAIADLAGQRVNFLLAFADTDRDAAVSQAEADSMRDRGHGRTDRSGHRRGMAEHGMAGHGMMEDGMRGQGMMEHGMMGQGMMGQGMVEHGMMGQGMMGQEMMGPDGRGPDDGPASQDR
jgi:hypothetical protein